jgi:thiol-disulfide isomerase/thioredoxin
MIFLHITKDNTDDLNVLLKHIQQGDDVFVIVHKTGCPPCMATVPKWEQLENALAIRYKNNNKVVIADINQEVGIDQLAKFMGEIEGFPTMRYIAKNGKKIEEYEKFQGKNPQRSTDSFIEWIESKIVSAESVAPVDENINKKDKHKQVYKRLTYRNNYRPKPKYKRYRTKKHKKYFGKTKKYRR